MRFLKLGCHLTGLLGGGLLGAGLLGAVTLALAALATLATGAASANASTPSGWRISATIGSASSEIGTSDLVVTGPANAWTTWTCGPCPSGSQPKQNLMLHWDGRSWSPVALPAKLRFPTVIAGMQASSARNLWVFTEKAQAVVFDGTRWTVKDLPSWVERPVVANEATVASAVFSSSNVWAFSLDAAKEPTLAGHFTNGGWHKVTLPIIPGQVAPLAPDDIWLSGFAKNSGPRTLAHWNGKSWTTVSYPQAAKGVTLIPSGLVARGARSLWTTAELFGPRTGEVRFQLLHWTGSWSAVDVPASVGVVSQFASDGHGGFWLIASHAGTSGSITGHFAHFANGKWATQPIPNRGSLQSEPGALASVPGSRSMWAVGFLVDKSTPEFGEILRFGK